MLSGRTTQLDAAAMTRTSLVNGMRHHLVHSATVRYDVFLLYEICLILWSEFFYYVDPNWRLCASDPVVEAAVAKLNLAMTTSMGILGCLTTAWWGSVRTCSARHEYFWLTLDVSLAQLSDRHGRTRVMGFAVVGALVADSNFLIVYHFAKYLPGGYWFLLFGLEVPMNAHAVLDLVRFCLCIPAEPESRYSFRAQ